MHTDVILTNKRCIHAQSNYTNTKLKQVGRSRGSSKHRVTTCLENLEMSGNLEHVREMSGEKSCHGKVSQNCSYTNMRSFYANTLNNNTIYLTLTPEVLATVYLNISISFKNSA